jgi:gliding motility-associated-like protein
LFYAKNNYECEVIDTVNVYVGGIIFLPNAFTPDNDGKNDVYFAKGYNIENFEMNIFDRWGNLVFKSNDIMQGWDGTINGQPAPMGVYQVTVFYTDAGKKQGQIIEKALLIR